MRDLPIIRGSRFFRSNGTSWHRVNRLIACHRRAEKLYTTFFEHCNSRFEDSFLIRSSNLEFFIATSEIAMVLSFFVTTGIAWALFIVEVVKGKDSIKCLILCGAKDVYVFGDCAMVHKMA